MANEGGTGRREWNADVVNSSSSGAVLFQRILKSKWQPRDAGRVLKHDLAVQKNWDLLQNGKLKVDPELKVHLSQFTQRTVPASHKPGNDRFL
jgi:hypothetical protein